MTAWMWYFWDVMLPYMKAEGGREAVALTDNAPTHSMNSFIRRQERLPDVDGIVRLRVTEQTLSSSAPQQLADDADLNRRVTATGIDLVFMFDGEEYVIKLRWLPSRTTSILQPCDQGIILYLKRRWTAFVRARYSLSLIHI